MLNFEKYEIPETAHWVLYDKSYCANILNNFENEGGLLYLGSRFSQSGVRAKP